MNLEQYITSWDKLIEDLKEDKEKAMSQEEINKRDDKRTLKPISKEDIQYGITKLENRRKLLEILHSSDMLEYLIDEKAFAHIFHQHDKEKIDILYDAYKKYREPFYDENRHGYDMLGLRFEELQWGLNNGFIKDIRKEMRIWSDITDNPLSLLDIKKYKELYFGTIAKNPQDTAEFMKQTFNYLNALAEFKPYSMFYGS